MKSKSMLFATWRIPGNDAATKIRVAALYYQKKMGEPATTASMKVVPDGLTSVDGIAVVCDPQLCAQDIVLTTGEEVERAEPRLPLDLGATTRP